MRRSARARAPARGWGASLATAVLITLALLLRAVVARSRDARVSDTRPVMVAGTPGTAPTETPTATPTATRRRRTALPRVGPRVTRPTGATPIPLTPTAPALVGLTEPTAAVQGPDKDHYWLQRPFAAGAVDRIEPLYPYASVVDGTYPIHHGVEFENPMDTPILAMAAGTIAVAGEDSAGVLGPHADYYGMLVIEQLDERFEGRPVYVLYGHLAEVGVEVGQHVKAGDPIGRVGMSGIAEGPHLHMEVRYGRNDFGATVNPELWLSPHAGHGALVGLVSAPDGQPLPEVWVDVVVPNDAETSVREVMTYPATEVNADPSWHENWCAGDLEAGEYDVQVYLHGGVVSVRAVVEAGKTTRVTLP